MPVPDTALAEAALANRAAPDRGALPLSVSGLRVVAGGRTILDIPSLEVAAGALVVLRGASGAGKSTALNVLSGNMAARAGRVRWGATDIAALPPSGRRRFRRERLGLLFQDYRLFAELGALDNAALPAAWAPAPRRAGLRATARASLDRLGLADAARRPVAVMSGGERQRVAMARALSTGPAVILADEPTASLDRENADRLADDLALLAGAHTLVVVSHDPAMQARATRLLTLADGRIVDDSDA